MRARALAVVGLVALAGCGGEQLGRVTGRVTVAGTPVTGGTIQFVPDTGKAAIGSIEPDGTYSLTTYRAGDGALVGPHKVVIHCTHVGAGSIVPATFEDELKPAKGDSGKMLVPGRVEWVVPERYSQLSSTDLSATVARGDQTINFDVPAR
jgi:hypothetical protein